MRRGGATAGGSGIDALVAILGLLAHEHDRLVTVIPFLLDRVLEGLPLSLDNERVLLTAPELEDGSRWCDGRLSGDEAYTDSDGLV